MELELCHRAPSSASLLHLRLPPPPPSTSSSRRRRLVPKANQRVKEIRVCVNRTCAKQGARETLSVLSDIAPPGVSVVSCGCLGRCGAGPNLVALPDELMVGHCGTAARAADLLAELLGRGAAGLDFDPRRNLEALMLRKKGEAELADKGNPSGAVDLLSHAIDLKPSGGLHVAYKTRSAARLAMGDTAGALEDAKEASKIAPKFPQVNRVIGILTENYLIIIEKWVGKILIPTSVNELLPEHCHFCVVQTIFDNFHLLSNLQTISSSLVSRLQARGSQAYICEGDVYMAMEEWDAADKAYLTALQLDPSIRRSKSFKARVAKLKQTCDAAASS